MSEGFAGFEGAGGCSQALISEGVRGLIVTVYVN